MKRPDSTNQYKNPDTHPPPAPAADMRRHTKEQALSRLRCPQDASGRNSEGLS